MNDHITSTVQVERLSDQELIYQLIRLETRADLNLGDLPAAQVLRAAARRIELKNRAIADLREGLNIAASELERYVDLQQKLDYIEYAADTQKKLDVVNAAIAKAEG